MNHSGTFAHATDRNGFTANFKCNSNFFFMCICSHNRLCSRISCFHTVRKLWCQCINTCHNTINRKLFANDTGRCHTNCTRRDSQYFSCLIGGLLTIIQSFLSGAGVCNTCIDNNCLRIVTVFHDIPIPEYRCCLYKICRKRSCYTTRYLAVNHCHISTIFIFDSCRGTSCLESFCRCRATCNLFHDPILLSDTFSHRYRCICCFLLFVLKFNLSYSLNFVIFSSFNIKS